MAPEVQRVLVTFCFVLILESVLAVRALILLLGLMSTVILVRTGGFINEGKTYLRASSVSNFLGFFGQQSHTKPLCTFKTPFFD